MPKSIERLTILVLCLAASSAFAQKVYKCGNTYSQQPCGANTQEIEIKAPPPDPNSIEGVMEGLKRLEERLDATSKSLDAASKKAEAERKKNEEIMKKREAARALQEQELTKQAKEEEENLKAELETLRGRPMPSAATIKNNFDRCKSFIKRRLKDPMSAVFDQQYRHQEPMIITKPNSDRKVLAHPYRISVNAKNSFGGYVGFKSYSCFFDVNEDDFLFILD